MSTEPAASTEVAAFWEGLYRERPQRWSGKVNAVLAAVIDGEPPGSALDLGCGEGGDAIWLAERGWEVTVVDVSTIAVERGAATATDRGLSDRITWEVHELGASFPSGSFDLVSAQFLQSPVELARIEVLRQGAQAVRPGGLLLTVGHAAFPPWAQHHDHDKTARFPTPEEELAELDLDGWDVRRCEIVEREGVGPDGQIGTLFDSVLLLRRHTV